MARPVIAKRLVEIARKEGAVAICMVLLARVTTRSDSSLLSSFSSRYQDHRTLERFKMDSSVT